MRNILIVVLAMILMAGCKTTKTVEVPVEVPKTQIVYQHSIDTFIQKDSVDRLIYMKGDTVYNNLTQYKWLTKIKTDTIHKTDSISVPVYITKTVTETKNVIYWWQWILMILGGIVLVIAIYKLYVKIKSKTLV